MRLIGPTLVTKRRKLLLRSGTLSASLCVVSCLGPPPSIPLAPPEGSFGRLGGNKEDSSMSETLLDKDGSDIPRVELVGFPRGAEEGGNGRCGLALLEVGEAEMSTAEGEGMRMALGGTLEAMYGGTDIVVIWCQTMSRQSFSSSPKRSWPSAERPSSSAVVSRPIFFKN